MNKKEYARELRSRFGQQLQERKIPTDWRLSYTTYSDFQERTQSRTNVITNQYL